MRIRTRTCWCDCPGANPGDPRPWAPRIIEDGELDVMEASWSSWAEEQPGPNSPPTRKTHEAYNKAGPRVQPRVALT